MVFNSSYFVFILIPCLLILPTIGQVLTTSSAYAGSYIFDSTTYSQIGAFSSSYVQDDTLILTTKSGFVVFDLASRNWLNSTGFNAGDNGSVRIKAFDTGTFTPTAPYYDPVWSRIIVADGESSNPKLAAYDFDTLNILNNQQHVTNPKLASALKGVFGVVADDTYLYYASSSASSNIARYALRDWGADPVLLSLSAYSLSKSFARDNETK